MAKFQVYRDVKNEYRWRFLSTNGNIIADSGEGYTTRASCDRGIEIVKTQSGTAPTAG